MSAPIRRLDVRRTPELPPWPHESHIGAPTGIWYPSNPPDTRDPPSFAACVVKFVLDLDDARGQTSCRRTVLHHLLPGRATLDVRQREVVVPGCWNHSRRPASRSYSFD